MFKKILVCLDGSRLAEQILPYVKAQAAGFSSEVTLVQVVKPEKLEEAGVRHLFTPVLEELKDAEKYLENIALRLREQSVNVKCNTLPVVDGVPAKVINSYANENQADLIMLTTHGKSGLERAIIGSVADAVIRESDKLVFVIRPE